MNISGVSWDLLAAYSQENKSVNVSMITATSMKNNLPFNIFNEKSWKPEIGAQFVKIHIYPDQPVTVSRIEIESDSRPFSRDVVMYINFNEHVVSLSFVFITAKDGSC